MDYGKVGFEDTINTLKSNNYEYFGAGDNVDEASKLKILNHNNSRIAILGLTENEFSLASEDSPGANPIDFPRISYIINNNNFDYLIILLHGGLEYYQSTDENSIRYDYVVAENSINGEVSDTLWRPNSNH